uniref:Uncharacterized protein n=1 Tax=Anguilla anguilla TaxID=7936 RepID=A0A0E9SMC3_ANGAN
MIFTLTQSALYSVKINNSSEPNAAFNLIFYLHSYKATQKHNQYLIYSHCNFYFSH